ncbi:MAG: hypothetical protein ACRCZF_14510 [Gemmataceae bacterium]
MQEAISILLALILVAGVIMAVRGGELPMRPPAVLRRSERPLLFFTMIGVYLLFGLIVLVCVSGYFPALINLTL